MGIGTIILIVDNYAAIVINGLCDQKSKCKDFKFVVLFTLLVNYILTMAFEIEN